MPAVYAMREAVALKAVLLAMSLCVLNVKRECISIRLSSVSYLVSTPALLAQAAILLVV